MPGALGVKSAYYAWEKRPKSARDIENEELAEQIKNIHKKKNRTCGCRKMTQELRRNTKFEGYHHVAGSFPMDYGDDLCRFLDGECWR